MDIQSAYCGTYVFCNTWRAVLDTTLCDQVYQ
jgi:hypothetical protein